MVAIGRGFLVFALANNVTLNFDDSDRLNEVNAVFRKESLPDLSYKVKLDVDFGNSDVTSVHYGNYHSEFIKNEDAIKIFGPEFKGNSIYCKVNTGNIAMNYLPTTNSKDIIPLEVKLAKQGQITITSEKFNVSKNDYNLIFEDRKFGRFINFDADFQYNAVCNEGVTEGRFFIHTIAAGYEDNITAKTTLLNSYYANGKIMLQTQAKENEQALVLISDVSGRIIYSDKVAMQGLKAIDASQFSKGIYNITLTYNNGDVESQKLAINN